MLQCSLVLLLTVSSSDATSGKITHRVTKLESSQTSILNMAKSLRYSNDLNTHQISIYCLLNTCYDYYRYSIAIICNSICYCPTILLLLLVLPTFIPIKKAVFPCHCHLSAYFRWEQLSTFICQCLPVLLETYLSLT